MALASNTVFEVRPGTGSATNGGGFVPGSSGADWSQQNVAQYSVTDAVGNGTATVTSATAAFGTDVVGNIACIQGAWYQIASRTNSTTIVLDRATGTFSGGTLKIGGALDLCATAEPLLTAGMTLWIKVGTQTITTAINLTNSGDSTSGVIAWNGYDVTRGDHTGNRPLITTSTNNADLLQCTANFRSFNNIALSSTAGTPGNGFTANKSGATHFVTIANMKISGCACGVDADDNVYFGIRNFAILNSEITGCVDAVRIAADIVTIDGCYLHANTGYGINVIKFDVDDGLLNNVAFPVTVRNAVVYSNLSGGIYVQSAAGSAVTKGTLLDIDHCAIVSNMNDGIQLAIANANLSMLSIQNTIVYGNSGYGANVTNAAAIIILNRNNAYGSNMIGARNNLAAGAGAVTLSADPFTARTANDFTLNTTGGGGAACRAAGFPGSIPGLVAAGSADVGALQHADPAAVGGVFLNRRPVPSTQRQYVTRLRSFPVQITVTNNVATPLAIRRTIVAEQRRTVPRRAGGIIIPAPGTPVIVLRQQQVRTQVTSIRTRSSVIPAAPVTVPVILPARRRQYPIAVPVRRINLGAALLASPPVIVPALRTRIVTRVSCVRHLGSALFSTVTNTQILASIRRRAYPVYVPARRSVAGVALFAAPIVIRSPLRSISRQHPFRRNAGNALFLFPVAMQTVLVSSPRIVR